MFKFTDDKIGLFIQTYVHNNKNTSIVHFIKLFFQNKFFNAKKLQKTKELKKLKERKQQKKLQNLIKNLQHTFLQIFNKKNYINKIRLNYIYNRLLNITILNNNETQKKYFENNLTLNKTILY